MKQFNPEERYDVVVLNGDPYLFINARVERASIPAEYLVYEVADGGSDGCFAKISEHITVNHWGTLIGFHELPMDENRHCYYPKLGTAEYEGCYIGAMNLAEYDEYLNSEFDDDDDEYADEQDIVDGEYAIFEGHDYTITVELTVDDAWTADDVAGIGDTIIETLGDSCDPMVVVSVTPDRIEFSCFCITTTRVRRIEDDIRMAVEEFSDGGYAGTIRITPEPSGNR